MKQALDRIRQSAIKIPALQILKGQAQEGLNLEGGKILHRCNDRILDIARGPFVRNYISVTKLSCETEIDPLQDCAFKEFLMSEEVHPLRLQRQYILH